MNDERLKSIQILYCVSRMFYSLWQHHEFRGFSLKHFFHLLYKFYKIKPKQHETGNYW